jgi:hypothetical protein
MANLISDKQKKIVRGEYIIRLATMSFFMLSVFGLFVLAYVLPYYFSLVRNDTVVSKQLETVINTENKENTGQSVQRIVMRTLDQVKLVEFYSKNTSTATDLFSKVIADKNDSIQLSRLSWSAQGSGREVIVVSGLAKSRSGLVDFIETLKTDKSFTEVESPISDFARESNIPFTINIVANI